MHGTKICLLLVILKMESGGSDTEQQFESASEVSPSVAGLFIFDNEALVLLFLVPVLGVLGIGLCFLLPCDSAVLESSDEDSFLPFGFA